MKLRLSHIAFSTALITVLIGCKKTTPPNFHYEYFGYEEGRYVIYDVVEITHDKNLNQHDTLVYQLKTKWGEPYFDNENREGKEFLRFIRSAPSDPWVLTDKWYGLYDGIRAELIEENQRRVKLVFAPTYSKTWKINAPNMDEEIECYYRDIHGDTTINGVYLDSTLVVETDLSSNAIYEKRAFDMYATNIGLVYKYYKNNRYFNFGDTEVGEGYELYYSFVSSGIE